MKKLLPLALAFSASTFVACTTNDTDTRSTEVGTTQTNEASAKEGWSDVKTGTKEAVGGAGEIARDVGTDVKEGTKEVGRDIKEGAKEVAHDVKSAACPVLGNKKTKTYYTKDMKSYDGMLSGKKALPSENRECFMTEANAREAGFRSAN